MMADSEVSPRLQGSLLDDGDFDEISGNCIIIVQRVEHKPRLALPYEQVWSANTRSTLL